MAATGDDCYFFFYSTCSRGDMCPYRHCEAARGNEVTCTNWRQGFCYRSMCAFRHMEIVKNRSEIQCYWETQPTGCQKPHCPFRHINRPSSGDTLVNKPSPSAVSLINKLPTITGPVIRPPPPITDHPKSAVQPVLSTIPDTSQSMDDSQSDITMPTVAPFVVTPMDSEDDDSFGTLSSDGSPSKKMILSPPRPPIKPSKEHVSPSRQTVIPTIRHKPESSQGELHLELGIKTLAEIRRENAERGHIEDVDVPLTISSRRVITVGNSSVGKIKVQEMEVSQLTRGHSALQLSRRTAEGVEVKSLSQLRLERQKRPASSKADKHSQGEEGSNTKRVKVIRVGVSNPQQEDVTNIKEGDGICEKKIVRRVMIGAAKGSQNNTSAGGTVKIKTLAEIKKEKLQQRLGKQVQNNKDVKNDEKTFSDDEIKKSRLAKRLGKPFLTKDNKDPEDTADVLTDGIKIKSLDEIKRERLLKRLGKINTEIDFENAVTLKPLSEVKKEEDGKDAGLEEIKVKTLSDIRREKLAHRLGQPVSSRSDEETDVKDRENVSGSCKKALQSAAERRTKKRVEIALYKPPGAVTRGSKENKEMVKVTRISERSQDTESSVDDNGPKVRVRRLNLSKSVEDANKGTESVMSVIRLKKDEPMKEAVTSSIQIKSLVEIRAEKQRQTENTNNQGEIIIKTLREIKKEKQSLLTSDDDSDERTNSSDKSESKSEDEIRKIRRANIWNRSVFESKPEKPEIKPGGGGDADGKSKSLDELRRERRARLWNTALSTDSVSKPVKSKPVVKSKGQINESVTKRIERDAAPEIKIKTLAEIRREKQIRYQQIGDSVITDTTRNTDSEQKEICDSLAVNVPATGDPINESSAVYAISAIGTCKDLSPVSAHVGPSRSDSEREPDFKPGGNPVTSRRGRQVSNLSQGNIKISTCSTTTEEKAKVPDITLPQPMVQLVQPDVETAVSLEDSRHSELAGSNQQELEARNHTEIQRAGHEDTSESVFTNQTEPDTTTTDVSLSDPVKPGSTSRLMSMTDDDLDQFLGEDEPVVTTATHDDDDDDLLNKLDDFLNS